MKVSEFRKKLKQKILVMDGAMATEIQSKNLTEEDFRGDLFKNSAQDLKGNNDLLNLTQPEVIKKIHRSFLSKGSDFISTNTFNASSISQNDYGLENALVEWLKINHFAKTDFLVAISSSGKSKNILHALEYAFDSLALTFSIFGMDGVEPFPADHLYHSYIHIDSHNYGVIELTSEIILHGIVEELVIE